MHLYLFQVNKWETIGALSSGKTSNRNPHNWYIGLTVKNHYLKILKDFTDSPVFIINGLTFAQQ
jgi:hypothetical protein